MIETVTFARTYLAIARQVALLTLRSHQFVQCNIFSYMPNVLNLFAYF